MENSTDRDPPRNALPLFLGFYQGSPTSGGIDIYLMILGSALAFAIIVLLVLLWSRGRKAEKHRRALEEERLVLQEAEAAEQREREEAARRAQEEVARKTRSEAERKAREAHEAAERRARAEAEQRAREEAERSSRVQIEQRTREEAERRARDQIAQKARAEEDAQARVAAQRQAQDESQRRARQEAETRAKQDLERMAGEDKEQERRRARESAEQRLREGIARALGDSKKPPIPAQAPGGAVAKGGQAKVATGGGHERQILLAEDSITMQRAFKAVFAGEGYNVTAVSTAEEAIGRARQMKPDIVIADLSLEGKNGYDICSALKASPEFARIPILLLHGSNAAFDEDRARAAGADGSVAKPFDSQELIDQVKSVVAARR